VIRRSWDGRIRVGHQGNLVRDIEHRQELVSEHGVSLAANPATSAAPR
jgi:hypothetical protein